MMPVGTVYANASVSTNPGTLFGFGTWVAIEGQCVVGLVAGGEFDTLGAVSEGETTHALTAAETPLKSHTHTNTYGGGTGTETDQAQGSASLGTKTTSTPSVAEANGTAHNNIQPSYVAYVWRRTA